MNYYSHHIGDWTTATRALSWTEDMAYRRLVEFYYTTEAPLPCDRKRLYRLAGATEPEQQAAIDFVLSEFFIETPDGFRNGRCDEEIAAFDAKRTKAANSAKKRWDNEGNANAMPTHMPTHSEGNAPIPNPNSIGEVGSAREPLADLEARLREAAGWQSEPAPNLAVTGPVYALIEAGAIPEIDVFPVVRSLAPQCRKRTSWNYFLDAIARARDDRIAAGKIVSTPSANRTTANARKPTIADAFADFDADLAAAKSRTDHSGTERSAAPVIELSRLREGIG